MSIYTGFKTLLGTLVTGLHTLNQRVLNLNETTDEINVGVTELNDAVDITNIGISGIEDNTDWQRELAFNTYNIPVGYGVEIRTRKYIGNDGLPCIDDWSIIGGDDNVTPTEHILGPRNTSFDCTFFDTPSEMICASSSTEDWVLGEGAFFGCVNYLDINGDENEDFFSLTGQTPVEIGITATAINRIVLVGHGPFSVDNENVGYVNIGVEPPGTWVDGVPQVSTAQCVGPSWNITQTALYTVPVNHVFCPTVYTFSSDASENKVMTMSLYSQPLGATGFLKLVRFPFATAGLSFQLPTVDQVAQGGRIKFTGQASSGSTNQIQLFFQGAVVNTNTYRQLTL